jgi:hypothetical protein
MDAPAWVSYVGLVGGLIGTITGCLAYWRTGQLKALDLRLELRKADADLRHIVVSLPDLLARASGSRAAVAAAAGRNNSGWLQAWMNDLTLDRERVGELGAAQPASDADYRCASAAELESALVNRHELVGRALSA